MFTGLVEGIGTVVRLSTRGKVKRITLSIPATFIDLKAGDSLAVSGTCLTVVDVKKGEVTLEAVPETLSRTTFAGMRAGNKVNLERAVRADSRLGGHFVQGHVDGIGKVSAVHRLEEIWVVTVSAPGEILKGLVEKGSVALDGVSLTITEVSGDGFGVVLVPHTLKHTTLGSWKVGEEVNIEGDILSKYVARHLASGVHPEMPAEKRELTLEWLAEEGYL
jgi:riboflavin synthase